MTSSHINTIWLQLQIQITSFQISIRRLLLNWINRKCLCVLSTMLDAACMEKNKTSLRRHKSLKTHTFSCGQWMATQFWESRSLQSSRGILRGKWEKKSAKMQKSEIYARSQGGRTAEDGRGQQRKKGQQRRKGYILGMDDLPDTSHILSRCHHFRDDETEAGHLSHLLKCHTAGFKASFVCAVPCTSSLPRTGKHFSGRKGKELLLLQLKFLKKGPL